MIQKHLKHHGTYHVSLVLFLLLGVIIAYYTRDNRQLQMLIIMLMAFAYITWGIVHHYLIHDLTPKIVIEYIAMASLGVTLALFLIKGFTL